MGGDGTAEGGGVDGSGGGDGEEKARGEHSRAVVVVVGRWWGWLLAIAGVFGGSVLEVEGRRVGSGRGEGDDDDDGRQKRSS